MIWPLLLLFLWPLVMDFVGGVGVEPPSTSNSMSMASSLLQTLSANAEHNSDFVESLSGGTDHHGQTQSENNYRPEECRVKNLKQQQKMTMAKLDAHRCLIRDVVVQVPVPDTLIATYVHPSHIVVPRCTGLCLERPGCTCVPKKSRHIKVEIVVGINSTSVDQLCSHYEIEEHRGPCRCKCLTKTCHYNKDLDRENCQCRCKSDFAALKRECATTGRTTRTWDEETCTCQCRPRVCVEGHYQDIHTCECKPVESTCTAIGVRDDLTGAHNAHSSHQLTTGVSKYIGLTCMILLTLIMLITLYILIQRRRQMSSTMNHGLSNLSNRTLPHGLDAGSIASLTGTLRNHSGLNHATSSGGTTAYTITINSQAANVDESILPLTEDKTRF